MQYIDILPNLIIGLVFTAVGVMKFYGLWQCIEGGRDKPLFQYMCGT